MTLGVVLLILGGVLGLIGYVWLIVEAFRVSLGWGLAVLLLGWTWVPLILFAVGHWPAARRPLLVWGIGFVVSVLASAVTFLGVGAQVLSSASAPEARTDETGRPAGPAPGVLPPPRPTALPTHPSWEAVVSELGKDQAPTQEVSSWEELVPERREPPATASIPWQELSRYAGRRVEIDLANGTEVTAQLVGAEAERIRVRHVVGGGVVAYWIARDQVVAIRPAR